MKKRFVRWLVVNAALQGALSTVWAIMWRHGDETAWRAMAFNGLFSFWLLFAAIALGTVASDD